MLAMNGLDDLRGEPTRWRLICGAQMMQPLARLVEYYPDMISIPVGWPLRGAIQPHIDMYLSKETFAEVKVTVPSLVQKELATGGDVS